MHKLPLSLVCVYAILRVSLRTRDCALYVFVLCTGLSVSGLSICLSICLCDCVSVCLSVCLCVCVSDCLSVCLSVGLSIRLSICQSV